MNGGFAAATVGTTTPTTAATGYEQAVSGGPDLGSTGPANGTVFALTQSAATLTASATTLTVQPDTTTDADGATLTAVNTSTNSVELKIPSLSIDQTFTLGQHGATASSTLSNGQVLNFTLISAGLNYTALGTWSIDAAGSNGMTTNISYFILGYQTAPTSMPTSGSATYSGTNNVTGVVGIQGGSSNGTGSANLTGNASLTANFGTGAITGSLSNMMATPSNGGSAVAWDSVSLSGSISGALFSGTTAVASTPGTSYSLAAGGTGTLRGGFYGPSANEVGAVWTLHDATGSGAVGSLGAATGTAPSDRRLKRDIVPAGRLANGLDLYDYAYLGDERRFTGVMAQGLLADPRFAGAVLADADGLMRVDYAQLGLAPPDFAAMVEAGEQAMSIYRAS